MATDNRPLRWYADRHITDFKKDKAKPPVQSTIDKRLLMRWTDAQVEAAIEDDDD